VGKRLRKFVVQTLNALRIRCKLGLVQNPELRSCSTNRKRRKDKRKSEGERIHQLPAARLPEPPWVTGNRTHPASLEKISVMTGVADWEYFPRQRNNGEPLRIK
jgi:hypothetical protein